jgi:hypothetical protein
MRNATVQLPAHRGSGERGQVVRDAVRQLERADLYLAAVAHMELDDREFQRAVSQLRTDVESLRRHLGERRNRLGE